MYKFVMLCHGSLNTIRNTNHLQHLWLFFVHRLTIEALNIGEPLLVEASRLDFFVFGHHMGKADLRYLITASGTG